MPRLSIPILVFTLQDNEDEIKSKDTTKTKRSGKERVYCSCLRSAALLFFPAYENKKLYQSATYCF